MDTLELTAFAVPGTLVLVLRQQVYFEMEIIWLIYLLALMMLGFGSILSLIVFTLETIK